MPEQERVVQHAEGSPWFWKIFGGAIMGLISILLLGHITSINSNIDRVFFDLRGDMKEIHHQIESQRDRTTQNEQNLSSCKERIVAMEKSLLKLQASLEEHKQRVATCEANGIYLKEDVKVLREWNKEMTRQIQELRDRIKKPEN